MSHVRLAARARPALAVPHICDLAAVAREGYRQVGHGAMVMPWPVRPTRLAAGVLGFEPVSCYGRRAADQNGPIRPALEVQGGDSSSRGTSAPQDASLVRRIRHRAREPGLPAGLARLLGRRSRRLGRGSPVGDLGGRGRLHQHALLRARGDVPGEVGRSRALRARGVAQVHDARRADRDVRLLDRLVGGARDQRHLHRSDRPGRLVPGRAIRGASTTRT